jgi:hypothetical protein
MASAIRKLLRLAAKFSWQATEEDAAARSSLPDSVGRNQSVLHAAGAWYKVNAIPY